MNIKDEIRDQIAAKLQEALAHAASMGGAVLVNLSEEVAGRMHPSLQVFAPVQPRKTTNVPSAVPRTDGTIFANRRGVPTQVALPVPTPEAPGIMLPAFTARQLLTREEGTTAKKIGIIEVRPGNVEELATRIASILERRGGGDGSMKAPEPRSLADIPKSQVRTGGRPNQPASA